MIRKAGASLEAEGLALLEEDLRSPCTEEIAVFRAFADAVQPAGSGEFLVAGTEVVAGRPVEGERDLGDPAVQVLENLGVGL